MSYKVQLINKDLGRSCLFGRVQGLSGKTYATSRYQPCGHHVAELTAEEYKKAVDDISRAWQRPMCRWIPMFVEVVETAQGVMEAQGTEKAEVAKVAEREELSKLPMTALRKRAKLAGVALKAIRKKGDIIQAIIAGGGAAETV